MSEEYNSDEPGVSQDASPDVPIDFTTFILSLSSSAAFHLGLAPHPDKDACCENLPMAKHTIDILALLQEKTKGNLTGEDERMITDNEKYRIYMRAVRDEQGELIGYYERDEPPVKSAE